MTEFEYMKWRRVDLSIDGDVAVTPVGFREVSLISRESNRLRNRCGACELRVLRIARLGIDERALFSRHRIGWDTASDHRSKVLVNLILDLRDRLRMKHPRAKPHALC